MVCYIKNDMNDYLQDTSGNKSSKRLWGSIILSVGLLLSVATTITSVYENNPIDDSVVDILRMLFFTGGGLLSFGVVEVFGKGKK